MKYRISLTCLVLTLIATCTLPAHAQTYYSSKLKSTILKQINLPSGTFTIDQILLSIQQKSGIKIQMSPYLRGHKIFLNLSELPIISILNSICSMNNWRWYESVTPGTIVVKGYESKALTSINDLPQSLQSDMTTGFRRYIHHAANLIAVQQFTNGYLPNLKQAELDNDKVSEYIYKFILDGDCDGIRNNLGLAENAQLKSYMSRLVRTSQLSNISGKDITPQLQRIILLSIMQAGVQTVGNDSEMLRLMPLYYLCWPKTIILVKKDSGELQLSCSLYLSSNGNQCHAEDTIYNSGQFDIGSHLFSYYLKSK